MHSRDSTAARPPVPGSPPWRRAVGAGVLLAALAGTLLLMIASIRFGAANLTYADALRAVFAYDPDESAHVIVRELRFPRALAAVCVGAALGVSGALMQGMTRNALASPSIMGVTAGATFFLAVALAWIPGVTYVGMMFFSFAGAGMGAALVFGITSLGRGGITPVKLALAGSAITAFMTSLSTAIGIKFNLSKTISFWYAGGVSGPLAQPLYIALPFFAAGLALALLLSRSVSLLSLGEETAQGLGQHTGRTKLLGTIAVLLLTGAAVSIAGMIGFVGLVVPHIARLLVGSDYRWIIPCSALLGGMLLIAADIAGRLMNPPFETPVGAVTALVGVPFFLYLARKEGRGL